MLDCITVSKRIRQYLAPKYHFDFNKTIERIKKAIFEKQLTESELKRKLNNIH